MFFFFFILQNNMREREEGKKIIITSRMFPGSGKEASRFYLDWLLVQPPARPLPHRTPHPRIDLSHVRRVALARLRLRFANSPSNRLHVPRDELSTKKGKIVKKKIKKTKKNICSAIINNWPLFVMIK